ncbi:Uncharacterized protein FKW44_020407, partial [Caligus rogercresseyi]
KMALEPSCFVQEFPSLFSDLDTRAPMRHSVVHPIITSGAPCFAKARRLSGPKLAFLKAEIRQLLKSGILRPSSSPYSSAVHIVEKPSGGYRLCGDFRRLNRMSELDRYPLPNIRDFSQDLGGSTIFTKLDLRKAYHQIPVKKEDVPKTAIITPMGLFGT